MCRNALVFETGAAAEANMTLKRQNKGSKNRRKTARVTRAGAWSYKVVQILSSPSQLHDISSFRLNCSRAPASLNHILGFVSGANHLASSDCLVSSFYCLVCSMKTPNACGHWGPRGEGGLAMMPSGRGSV